ncbi:MAG TPA: hypothetical protein VGN01_03435 [Acidobacteriaceae bacterium]|jgi:hypothetical protein
MKRLHSSSALNATPAWSAAESDLRGLAFLSTAARTSETSLWVLAIAGLIFATVAANLMCLSPRWYSNRFIAFVYEPARFVVLTAATGACAVQIFWEMLNRHPSATRMQIVRNLSGGWVFLPCFVLLYEQNSPWMLFVVALISVGMALGLRRLMPAPSPAPLLLDPASRTMPSLYGLPPADSPLHLAFWIAILTQAAILLAANNELLPASYAFSIGVFLLAWRWSAFDPRTAERWAGKYPPLRQATLAILLTSMTLIPFAIGGNLGFLGLHRRSPVPVVSAKHATDTTSGYYGIILYPPPQKKQIVAPTPRSDAPPNGMITKPTTFPFDGQYWYYKAPNRRPGEKAHIAHGKPIDANINPRSTDHQPLMMEAHQTLPDPIDLACCGEIDIALTNADTRPGEIAIMALLSSSSPGSKFSQSLGPLTIPSSQFHTIPAGRAPVKEVLRFPIPSARGVRRFDTITVLFLPAYPHSRTGAKVSVDSFELIPKP